MSLLFLKVQKSKWFLVVFTTLIFSLGSTAQTFYYSKATGNLNTLGTWGTNTDGSGTSPLNFTSAGVIYIITNTSAATLGGAWTVSGVGSLVQLGDGITGVDFVIPAAFAFTGPIDVMNNGTLTIQGNTNPTIGGLASGSTVNFARAGTQTIPNNTYYNLVTSGTGQKNFANTTSSSISNSLIINSGSTIRFNTNNTLSVTITGSVSGAGAIVGNANSNLIINGSGDLGTLTFTTTLSLYQFIINRTSSGSLTLGSNLTVSNAFTHNDGLINLNGRLLTLNNAITFPASVSNGAFVGSSTSSITIGASATTITNPLFMDQTSASTRSLGRLGFNRATQTLILGNDLTVTANFVQTNGIVDLNGREFSINGIITFPVAITNGYIIGSTSSSMAVGGVGAITNALRLDQSNAGTRTINSFTVDHTGGTLTLGNDIICDGVFVHNNGPITIGATSLTLDGAITFPSAATNGSFTGSATSSLSIGGSGTITNPLFMSQATGAARTLNSFLLNRPSVTLALGNTLTVSSFTQTNGIISVAGASLNLTGAVIFPGAISNGAFSGSSTSTISIGASAGTITNPLFMDQTSSSSRSLGRFAVDRVGQTITLGNDLTVTNNFVQTNGIIDVNGRALSINGIIAFPAAIANGLFVGSVTSSLVVGGTGVITNALRLDQTNDGTRTINSFTVDHTGGTLTLGNNIICDGVFVHNNGPISVGATSLTLDGAITFPLAAANGSFTGSTTSSLSIGGAGTITNPLFMSQASAAARTLSSFLLNRSSVTLALGNTLTASSFTQTNGIISLAGASLNLTGAIIFPATISNGAFSGSSTSTISIGASAGAITNPLFMVQTNSTTRSLGRFAVDRVGQTILLGNDLTVTNNFVHTNSIIDLNGTLLSINGIITFPVAIANGLFIGSGTSSLSIGGAGAITNALRLDQTNAATRTVNSFTVDHSGGTLTLGDDLICDGEFIHNNGPITLGANLLSLDGDIVFPLTASNGSFTGSATSSLSIAGAGTIGNSLFMSQVSAAARSLNGFLFNRPGATVTLGNTLTVNSFTQTNGIVDLGGTLLNLNGGIIFPVSVANGAFTGSPTSSISIGASATTISNPLFMTQANVNTRSLSAFTISRVGQTIMLGNDLIVGSSFVHSNGFFDLNGMSLSLAGIITFPAAIANGAFVGSGTSSLTITGAGALTNTMKMAQTNAATRTINSFTLDHTGGTLSLGNDLICDGQFVHVNGPITIGTTLLTLDGNITFPVSASNGSFTGSATSALSIGGSGTIVNSLFMSQASAAARTINNFSYNRSGTTVALGNTLTVNTFAQTNGQIDLAGTLLNINGVITFPATLLNGSFIGSATSSLSIAGAGAISNSFLMDQTSSANRSLYDLTVNRAGQTLTIGDSLEIRNSITPTAGTIASAGLVKLKADAVRSAMVGVVGGAITGNIVVESFAPGPFTGWTNMGPSGVTGLTVADWEPQFPMTCYSCPYNENSTGGFFVSIQSYNEGGSGAAAYVPLSYSSPLTQGVGYWVYLGSDQFTTTAFTYTARGPAVTGNVVMPVTLSANSGFNLLSNPYAAPIDWDLVAADLSNLLISGSVYIYNPDLAQTISYAGGVSSPSGYITNGIIPMGQAFYVQATLGTNVTFRESHKSNQNTSANPLLKGRPADDVGTVFRLSIRGSNEDYDETAIRFHSEATNGYDRILDAYKLFQTPGYKGTGPVYSKYTSISSRLGNDDYSINSFPADENAKLVLPVLVRAQTSGSFVISPIDIQNLPAQTCVILNDRFLKVDHDLRTGPYVCNISDTTSVPRFELTICAGPKVGVTELTKGGANAVLIGQDQNNSAVVKTKFEKSTRSTISVYNVMGQKVIADSEIEGLENTVIIDLSEIPAQMFIVKVSNEFGQTSKKIVTR